MRRSDDPPHQCGHPIDLGRDTVPEHRRLGLPAPTDGPDDVVEQLLALLRQTAINKE